MPSAVFFTSYARLDNNKFTKLGEAVEELRERVRSLLGANAVDEIGFFDLEDIKTGSDWLNRLGQAVATCRMFVCFCSNTYFNREVCGKEFEAFRRRLAGANGRYVFPIIWDKCVLPKAVQQFQADNKALPKEYFEDGLLSLRRLRLEAEYEMAIDGLARAIADAMNDAQLPYGAHPIDFDNLTSAFDNPGQDAVRIGVLADEGLLWQATPGRTARLSVEEATSRFQIRWSQLECGLGLPGLLQASLPADQPIVLIVPTPSPVWQARLQGIDAALATSGRAPCAVLIGRAAAPTAGAGGTEDTIKQLFPLSYEHVKHHALFDERVPGALSEALRVSIDRLRASALASGTVAPIRDAALEASARSAGVPIERPVLSGPTNS